MVDVMKADLRAMKSMMSKIQPFVDGVQYTIGCGRLYTRYVDPAHVAMMEMTLMLEDCSIKPFDFDIELEKTFYKIRHLPLGDVRSKESKENYVELSIDDGKEILTFCHPMMTFRKRIKTDVVSSPYTQIKIPSGIIENIVATANINTRQFRTFLDIAGHETDHLSLIATNQNKKLRAEYTNEDDELTEMDLTYSLGGIEGIDLEFKRKDAKSVKSLFSIDYMQEFVGHLNAPTMKMGMGDDYPLTIWWNEKNILTGLFMVAPRIESG